MLFVHAHPDDESIDTGATMARYAAEGAAVTLVTCTLGEQGEIITPELALLAAGEADQLGGWRIAELTAALTELGVSDRLFLGGAGRFRDSGMMDDPANQHPRAFWRAATDTGVFGAAVGALRDVIVDRRPQVVVSYDERGGYGHPDHIMAHRVTQAAVDAAAGSSPGWQVDKVYASVMPRSAFASGGAAGSPFQAYDPAVEVGFLVDDELVTTVIDASAQLRVKAAAMAAHATQVTVHGSEFALSNNLGRRLTGVEYFRLLRGQRGPVDDDGREQDLFAGLVVGPTGVRR